MFTNLFQNLELVHGLHVVGPEVHGLGQWVPGDELSIVWFI